MRTPSTCIEAVASPSCRVASARATTRAAVTVQRSISRRDASSLTLRAARRSDFSASNASGSRSAPGPAREVASNAAAVEARPSVESPSVPSIDQIRAPVQVRPPRAALP